MGKGRETTQRVRVMKENFMDYYRQGMNIPQIANHCGVTTTTIYHQLEDIAHENGYSDRTDLLERIHPKHIITVKANRKCVTDFNEVVNLAKDLDNQISELISQIDNI